MKKLLLIALLIVGCDNSTEVNTGHFSCKMIKKYRCEGQNEQYTKIDSILIHSKNTTLAKESCMETPFLVWFCQDNGLNVSPTIDTTYCECEDGIFNW